MRYLNCCFFAAALIGVAGCSKPETPVEIGNREQVLHLGNLSEPTDLDPHVVTSVQNFNIISALFEGLLGHDPQNATPVPALAETWEAADGDTVFTFHLRPTARWSNGDPVTAHDFVKTYQRILSPGVASEYAYLHYVVKNAEDYANGKITDFSQVGYQAIDDHTLRITLKGPTPYFLKMLNHHSWYPLHLPTIEKFGGAETRGTEWTKVGNFVGNGPFNLTEWKINEVITVEKSDTYWDQDAVRLKAIRFYPIESNDAEERAFRAGQLHVTSTIPTPKIETYREKNPELLQIHPFFATYFLRFNTRVQPLDDVRVRRALAMSIDRDGIIRTLLKAGQLPAYNLTPPNIPGYTVPPGFEYDPVRAKQLLAEAGYPEGRGFPKLTYLFNTHEAHKQIAEALQQMWKQQLGIDITLENQEAKVYTATMSAGNYQIARYAWAGDYLDPNSFLSMMTGASGNNDTGWNNAGYNQLIAESDHTTDPAQRVDLMKQAEVVLMNDMPIAPMYFYTRNNLRVTSVQGWHPNLLDIHPYKYVWLKTD